MPRPEQNIGDAPYIREAEGFGMPDYEPVVGYCELCGLGIDIDPEFGDVRFCTNCNNKGCVHCLIKCKDCGEWFCDIGDMGKLEDSECFQIWDKENQK